VEIGNKMRRRIRHAALSLLAIGAILTGVSWAERTRNAEEEYAVYSTYLSEGLLNDAHDWSVGGPVQLVIEDTTKGGGNLRLRALYVLDGRVHFEQLYPSTRISFFVRNALETQILPKFVLPSRATVVIASESAIQSPEFAKQFPNNVGFVTLSGVGFNPVAAKPCFTSTTFVDFAAVGDTC
jgi:hypothetical protein